MSSSRALLSAAEDRGFQRGVELALLADRFEDRGAALLELAQVASGALQRAQLRVVEPAGDFLAVARDERHRGAAVEQGMLIDVTALEPANASAWVQRLKINRGLELGQAEVRRKFDRLSRYAPDMYLAQASVVQQYCPKWGGSAEKAHAFALECMRGGRPGSLAALSLLEAHLEIGMDWDDERNTVAYLRRPGVRAEIDEAAQRSVFHPAFRANGYRAITAHNHFALLYGMMGDFAAAKPHFQTIGEFGAGFFWSYFGDERTVFSALRAKALRA
jgi:hypothetical protein